MYLKQGYGMYERGNCFTGLAVLERLKRVYTVQHSKYTNMNSVLVIFFAIRSAKMHDSSGRRDKHIFENTHEVI